MSRPGSAPSLKQLRAFNAVTAAGSTLAAAKHLGITQPAVCYSLDRLEGELGVTLLRRSATGSFPTDAGRRLYQRTNRLFAQIIEAVNHVALGNTQGRSEGLAWKIREPQVKALIGIWRAGSFHGAARNLTISEPSLHRPARELERLLRTNLYRRTSIGMEVNPAGAELARRFSLALDEIRSAVDEIGTASASTAANLRVGVLALAPRMLVADASLELLRQSPRQRIDVVEAPYETLVKALRSGDIDLVFGALRGPAEHDDVVEEVLFEDPYVFVCAASHPLARARMVTPRQLASCEFVFPARGLPRRTVLDRMLAAWEITPTGRIETSCLATTMALLQSGERVTLLSHGHVQGIVAPDLHRIRVQGAQFDPRFVGLTTRAQWLPTPFQERFLQLVRAASHQPAKRSLEKRRRPSAAA